MSTFAGNPNLGSLTEGDILILNGTQSHDGIFKPTETEDTWIIQGPSLSEGVWTLDSMVIAIASAACRTVRQSFVVRFGGHVGRGHSIGWPNVTAR